MFNVVHIIQAGGLLLVAAIIFSESGMMVGFFFPGDTLLLSAGVLAASGKLSLIPVIIVVALAAIAGDNTGYQIGRQFGRRLFDKPDGAVFRHEHIVRAEAFYRKYGSKTMLLAHFIPVVRSFVPVTAGAGEMKLSTFILFDAIGDTAWAILITCLGYFVGSKVPGLNNYIDPVLLLVVIIFLAPTIYHVAKDGRVRKAIIRRFRK
jgi:membrane-associated protein